ncbi:hypothetical protein [Candidatus Binatus sp.]|uniref:hypothetical protein n=1 Tax=Candidatus Binatus sp. TaxID=2811406 RepID=UPI003BC91FFA
MKSNPERFVLGFIKFLGTPLCIAAILAATVAFTRARDGRWEPAALAASIALACGGAGFGAIWWVRFHTRAVDPSERLRAANPGAPWMWREDWARGEVRTSARRDANRLTVFAIAWCVATFPILFIAPHRAIRSADYFAIPSLTFPLIGLVMLAWAMRTRRRIRQYGESRFVMASVPGQIGGSLAGSIHPDKPPAAGQRVALELACINRTSRGTWHNLTTWDWILWRAEQTSMSDSTGSISVAFLIASDCCLTDDSNPKSRIVWRLSAKASGAAGGYRAEFEVPVFRIGPSSA